MKHELGFSKSFISMERLAEIVEQIREFSPKWMMLQPGMAALICECMERFHLEPVASVIYIEFTGEILTEEVRRRVQRHFPCRTANQYGANEFNSIAYECPEGHMHILKDNVYVEVLKDGKAVAEGEEGELYITTLTNSVMPLIRYQIGDIGKMYPNHRCACGNRAPILELTSWIPKRYLPLLEERTPLRTIF